MKRTLIALALVAILSVTSAVVVNAQVTYDPNAQDYVMLNMNQTYMSLATSAKKFLRAREQYEAKLISTEAYEQALDAYRSSKVSYDMALMRIIENSGYIVVEKAVKRTAPDGKKMVDIVLKNEVGGSFEIDKIKAFGARNTELAGGSWDKADPNAQETPLSLEELVDSDDVINATLPFLEGQGLAFEDIANLQDMNNIFVSIQSRSESNEIVMISNPYERRIDTLVQGQRASLTFELVRDVEMCTIQVTSSAGTFSKPVYLKQEATASGIEVQSQIPSVEAEMDNLATFNLNLQRFSTTSTTFALRVAHLPRQVIYTFIDADNNNQQVTRVNFTEGTVRKNLQLQLNMPTRTSENVIVDQSIPFKVLIMSDKEAVKFDALYSEHGIAIPDEELGRLNAGTVDLTVTPIGVGRLEVSASTFFYSLQPDEEVEMTITVKNTGTGILQNVNIKTDMPNNEWEYTVEPNLIRGLEPEQEARVKLTFSPPANATIGNHIVTIKVDAKERNRTIEATDKEVTIDIEAKPDIWGKLILIVLLIGIVLGIVVFGIKLSRR